MLLSMALVLVGGTLQAASIAFTIPSSIADDDVPNDCITGHQKDFWGDMFKEPKIAPPCYLWEKGFDEGNWVCPGKKLNTQSVTDAFRALSQECATGPGSRDGGTTQVPPGEARYAVRGDVVAYFCNFRASRRDHTCSGHEIDWVQAELSKRCGPDQAAWLDASDRHMIPVNLKRYSIGVDRVSERGQFACGQGTYWTSGISV